MKKHHEWTLDIKDPRQESSALNSVVLTHKHTGGKQNRVQGQSSRSGMEPSSQTLG